MEGFFSLRAALTTATNASGVSGGAGSVWESWKEPGARMDLGLKGKKVILTGGSRGIGRAALEIYAAEGADVAFFSRKQAQVDETVRSLSRHGGKVYGSTFDMNDLAAFPGWL